MVACLVTPCVLYDASGASTRHLRVQTEPRFTALEKALRTAFAEAMRASRAAGAQQENVFCCPQHLQTSGLGRCRLLRCRKTSGHLGDPCHQTGISLRHHATEPGLLSRAEKRLEAPAPVAEVVLKTTIAFFFSLVPP